MDSSGTAIRDVIATMKSPLPACADRLGDAHAAMETILAAATADETERELAQTLAHHGQLTRHIQALKTAGEPADSSFLRKLGWQLDACGRWIARYRRELEETA